MASEQPREPEGEGIKLSADVKPFVPKFTRLNAVWPESSEAGVFPSCTATYYPLVQELPVTEQKMYTEDMALGVSTLPPQCVSSDITIHPYSYSPYTLESIQKACSVPGSQFQYNQRCYRGLHNGKPRSEHSCHLPPEMEGFPKKKTYDEPKFESRRSGGTISSDVKSARGSRHTSIHGRNSLKSDVYHKRTDRKSRIIEKSDGSTSKPEFEYTRLDFPELQGTQNNGIIETPKQPKWGPLRSATTDISLLREIKPSAILSEGEIVGKNKSPTESVADNAANDSSSCTRDPKTISVASSEVLSSDPSYNKEKHIVHPTKKSKALQDDGNLEQNEVSRKNKKKKEKSKSKYEVLTVQEPPRIEDAEEFPNLAAASERRSRVESTTFLSKQEPQKKFKSSGKKSEIPVQLDLGRMLTALEKKQHSQNAKQPSKPLVFSVGAVPVLSKEATSGMKSHYLSQVQSPHNPLDSSAPMRKKGKQREVPKAKKPTSLKKIILKERQERKQQRLQENIASDTQDVESSGEEQPLQQPSLSGTGEIEEPITSALVEESRSEELLTAEPQSGTETCHLGLDSSSFPKIHSRRFRDYCSQMLSKEVDACVMDLLKELVRFQDRMYQKDPVKAKTKRRIVLGLREVLKHLKLKRLKCVIISPNCEKIQSKGGLDDTLHTIIDYACEQNIPFVFALNRKALGRSLNKAVPVSVVGIFSYDGAQDQFHKMVELTMAARQQYKTMLESVRQELAEESKACTPLSLSTQDPGGSVEDACPAPTEKEEPYYIEIWRKHLEVYNRCAWQLEESLGASTSQMMNLKL
ncbi:PREDICTED: selenocysteine insertion sequence-binding protein 2 [Chrysochloris asiatica]|uniref:Selenocysteine insertion sequence-binding protein 2 n=1 Tax=Chrysochloris asiatica TaxID=185453 RepID=A0A9B0TYI7_CHRAS|nr:PREDICTED: selenocysteine insertion sequence-binding protein 2 [Chrysochloris asiatica]